jgi:hypothetical protein
MAIPFAAPKEDAMTEKHRDYDELPSFRAHQQA